MSFRSSSLKSWNRDWRPTRCLWADCMTCKKRVTVIIVSLTLSVIKMEHVMTKWYVEFIIK